MSKSRTVNGKYVKITNGDHNMSSEGNIISKAVLNVGEKGTAKGVTRNNFERLGSNVNEDFEIIFSLETGATYSTLVPMGILDFEGKYENANFVFNYSLMLSNIDSLDFKILNEDRSTLYAVTNLPELVISAKRMPLLVEDMFKKKPKYDPFSPKNVWDWKSVFDPYNVSSNDYTKIGSYVILWDGFDNNEIYNSTNFNNKKLIAQITARKNGKEKTKEVEFSTEQIGVDWVDVKIDKKNKRIDTLLRVDLRDGGQKGLNCTEINSPFDPSSSVESCPWDKISDRALNYYKKKPIMTRTINFDKMKTLALDGIEKHWSRNGVYSVNLFSEKYQNYTKCINSIDNSINSLDLIYNTNENWGRSGNPGILGKIYYNVGYCNFLDWYQPGFIDNWGYLDLVKNKVDEDFMYTTAHELGHSILKAYGTTWHSFTHDDSSSIFQNPNGNNSYRVEKVSGEINLMHYFKDDPHQANYDFNLIVASEKDILGLIWLTKIEIK